MAHAVMCPPSHKPPRMTKKRLVNSPLTMLYRVLACLDTNTCTYKMLLFSISIPLTTHPLPLKKGINFCIFCLLSEIVKKVHLW